MLCVGVCVCCCVHEGVQMCIWALRQRGDFGFTCLSCTIPGTQSFA